MGIEPWTAAQQLGKLNWHCAPMVHQDQESVANMCILTLKVLSDEREWG